MAFRKEALLKAVKNYKPTYPSIRFQDAKNLKPKQLESARKHICPKVKVSEIVAFWDETMLNSGKKGFVLTCDTLYFSKEYYIKDNKAKHWVGISDIMDVKKKTERDVYKYVGVVHESGETEWIYTSINQDDLLDFFRHVIKNKDQKVPNPTARPASEPVPEKAAPRVEPEVLSEQPQKKESRCTCGGTLMDIFLTEYTRCVRCGKLLKDGNVVTCANCGGMLVVEDVRSKDAACQSCGQVIRVPYPDKEAEIITPPRPVPKAAPPKPEPAKAAPSKPAPRPEPVKAAPSSSVPQAAPFEVPASMEERKASIHEELVKLRKLQGIEEAPKQSTQAPAKPVTPPKKRPSPAKSYTGRP